MSAEIIPVPLGAGEVLTVDVDGSPFVVFRPAVEAIGLDYAGQITKLRSRSWANRRDIATVAADGKTRSMVAVDVPTFLMWLATVNETKVAAEVRPILASYQRESSGAIHGYWTKGGAINPRATEVQLDAIISQAEGQARVLKLLQGVVNGDWLEAQGRLLASRALGIEPELDPATRPLTVHEYLIGRGVPAKRCGEYDISFGGYLSRLHKKVRGAAPTKQDRSVGGVIRPICVYSERDRPLFDEVWEQRFAATLAVAA